MLTAVFICTWFVIIFYTPSPSGRKKHGYQRDANLPKLPKTKSRSWHTLTIPRIRIIDFDENASEDKEEREREAQLRDDKHIGEFKEVAPNLIRVVDPEDADTKLLWDLELDLVPHDLPEGFRTLSAVWNLAASWVKSNAITPEENPDLGAVLNAMATRQITSAEVGYKGTQLKARLVLSGQQLVVFKPGR